jgi:hypothetical protein
VQQQAVGWLHVKDNSCRPVGALVWLRVQELERAVGRCLGIQHKCYTCGCLVGSHCWCKSVHIHGNGMGISIDCGNPIAVQFLAGSCEYLLVKKMDSETGGGGHSPAVMITQLVN